MFALLLASGIATLG
jgi:hypothetical protein